MFFYFNAIFGNGIYEIDMSNLVPNVNSMYKVSNKKVKHNLDSTYLWHYRLAHISKKRIEKLQYDGLLKSKDDESFDKCVSCLLGKMTRKSFPHRPKMETDLLGLIQTDVCGPLRHVSRQVDARYADFLEKIFYLKIVSGREGKLEEIQNEDTPPSEITSDIPMEALQEKGVEGFEPPHEEEAHVRRSTRTHRAPECLCLNVEAEEHSLGDLNEPSNNKAAMLDPESDKWLDAMNAEMQSMKDNQVWRLVDFPPNCKTIRGFFDPKHPRKVCKLQKSIYGHKQASRSWNKRFDEEIKRFAFTKNRDEPCVYQKASESNVTFLILYVDDIIIMGNHTPSLQSVKTYLGKCFTMKDLGETIFILRIKIYQDRSKRLIKLSQYAYIDEILKGSIMYAVRCTRPDVAFAQNLTSRFQQNPGEPHWTAMKTILKYLRNTKDMFLVYGCVFVLNGGAVDWKSSKQSTTAISTIEAEYIAASKAGMEAVWIRKFILGLGIVPTIKEPIKTYCDNSAALHFANEPGVQRGTRHYLRRYHYVRECIQLGEIKLLKVHTYDDLADPFMKALLKGKLTQHVGSMGLRLASSFM
ncbi:retrotransposon protein, putative, ty1-copia subclass [Tanacetum coccineum]